MMIAANYETAVGSVSQYGGIFDCTNKSNRVQGTGHRGQEDYRGQESGTGLGKVPRIFSHSRINCSYT